MDDRTKRLDKMPAKLRVIVPEARLRLDVEVRPKYGCRTCEKTGADNVAGIVQAPAPAHLIEGGLPTEALVADVIVSKHADHCPLYRQSQIPCQACLRHDARSGVKIERSTLARRAEGARFQHDGSAREPSSCCPCTTICSIC